MNIASMLILAASLPGLAVEAPLILDPERLYWQTAPANLLRSSAFYTVRTRNGARVWHTEFPDHHTARLFLFFAWPAHKSHDLDSFRQRLRARARLAEAMGKRHEKIIVVVNYMPDWLSTSRNRRTTEGFWKVCNACPPRDMDAWRSMVKELALVMRKVRGATVYYEFWNEPDLFYWQAGADAFLELYAETARILKKFHPRGKVGGVGVNQWKGRFKKDPERGPVIFELLRYAKKKNVPLDFISWHHFGHPPEVTRKARKGYEEELRAIGWQRNKLEFLVTEWNISKGLRGGPFSAAMTADLMLGMVAARIDAQTIACWEDFHPRLKEDGLKGYGLITQDGVKKPAFHVHRFLDRLSRDTTGIALLRPTRHRTAIVSRKKDGDLEVVLWNSVPHPSLSVWLTLQQHGWSRDELRRAFRADRLGKVLGSRKPYRGPRPESIRAARRALGENRSRLARLYLWALDFPEWPRIQIKAARSVKTDIGTIRIASRWRRLTMFLRPNEVVYLRLGRR